MVMKHGQFMSCPKRKKIIIKRITRSWNIKIQEILEDEEKNILLCKDLNLI